MTTNSDSSFAGKTYLVVGASSGIGLVTAQFLLQSGADVHGWSRRESPELAAAGALQQQVDVTQEIDPTAMNLPAVLHGVVYTPGTINLAPFRQLKLESYRSDFEVNFLGAVRVLQAVQEPLLASGATGGGSVVLFSTVAVATGMAFHASVAAAKGAVEGFTRSMAAEFAPRNIRFNAVAPSLTDTPLAARLLGSEKKTAAAAERHPLKRVGRPEDIARAVLFLLDPENSWITGQVLGVDGGLSRLS